MAEVQVSIDKEVQINPQTGWVRGWLVCTANNKHLGRFEFNARNWEDFEIILGALQKIKDIYATPLAGPNGRPLREL